MNFSSPKTTWAAIAAAVSAAATAVNYLFDGDPSTNPDWGIVVSLIITAIGLATARDNPPSPSQHSDEPRNALSPGSPALPSGHFAGFMPSSSAPRIERCSPVDE